MEINSTIQRQMGKIEGQHLYCVDCREYPDVVIEVRKWGECEYKPLCAKCGGKLEYVD